MIIHDDETIVTSVGRMIRNTVSQLPNLETKVSEYPEIFHNEIHLVNEMWTCDGLRKIHLEYGETGKKNGNLEVLHCVFFPDPLYNLPIFGCDIVANHIKVTAAIVDISPVHRNKDIYKKIKPIADQYHDFDFRKLPAWADIFSPYCKFMRLNEDWDKVHYYELLQKYLNVYCEAVNNAEKGSIEAAYKRYQDQTYYCKKQKMNRKTEGVLSQWFDKEWANNYIENTLFDNPKPILNL